MVDHGSVASVSRFLSAASLKLFFLCFLSVVSCYRFANPGPPVDAQTAPKQAWSRLAALESFRFRLRYHTATPFALGADFAGFWHKPDCEVWTGYWRRGDSLERVEFRAIGERQYEKTRGGWQRASRGVETRIFDQVNQVLAGKEMMFQDSTKKKYRYRFEPWLPILDPARQKKLAGEFEIDRVSGLPLRVFVTESRERITQDPESGVRAGLEWEARFDQFNRAGTVVAPFVAEQEVMIAPEKKLSRAALGQTVATLRRRLERLNLEYRLERRCGRLVLALGRRTSSAALALLLARGRIELWTATRSSRPDSGLVVGDDVSFRVALRELIAMNGQYEVKAEVEPLPEPRISFELTSGDSAVAGVVQNRDTLVALVLDGQVLDCARGIDGNRVLFTGWGNKETALALAAVASSQALEAGFKILHSR